MVDPLGDVHRWMAIASVFSIALDHLRTHDGVTYALKRNYVWKWRVR
jgi:hypothetical protein